MSEPYQPIEYKFFGVDVRGQIQMVSVSKLNSSLFLPANVNVYMLNLKM